MSYRLLLLVPPSSEHTLPTCGGAMDEVTAASIYIRLSGHRSEQVVWFNNPVRVWCVAWQHMWLQPLILLFNEIWQDVSLCAHHMQGVTVQGNKRRIRFVHLIHRLH